LTSEPLPRLEGIETFSRFQQLSPKAVGTIAPCWFPHYLDFYFLIIWIQNLHFHIG
jgi:hypothetical protein